MGNKEGFFSSDDFLKDFKKWVNVTHDDSLVVVNSFVRPNSDVKTIQENMDCPVQNHTSKEIAKCFMKNGGKVKEIVENSLLISTKKGKFYLPKKYVD